MTSLSLPATDCSLFFFFPSFFFYSSNVGLLVSFGGAFPSSDVYEAALELAGLLKHELSY